MRFEKILTSPASEVTFTAIDFETTGSVAGWPVEPWQIGMCEVSRTSGIARGFDSLLRVSPERPFNRHAPGRHSAIRDKLATSPLLSEIWAEVSSWLVARPVVAHNIGTERTTLRKTAPLHAIGPWIDTLKLVRRYYPRLQSYALEDVLDSLGLRDEVNSLCPGRTAHDAFYDAVGCGTLLMHFLRQSQWREALVGDLI